MITMKGICEECGPITYPTSNVVEQPFKIYDHSVECEVVVIESLEYGSWQHVPKLFCSKFCAEYYRNLFYHLN